MITMPQSLICVCFLQDLKGLMRQIFALGFEQLRLHRMAKRSKGQGWRFGNGSNSVRVSVACSRANKLLARAVGLGGVVGSAGLGPLLQQKANKTRPNE